MKRFFPIVSLVFSILGFSLLFAMFQGYEWWYRTITFQTRGMAYVTLHLMYSLLAVVFAVLSPKGPYKFVLLTASILLLLSTSAIAFIGIFGFQSP